MFGQLRVVWGDQTLTQFRTQKAGWLLGYLSLNLHRAHLREKLLDLFWPELDIDAGRNNLSTTLSALRRQLASMGLEPNRLLIADRQTIRLDSSLTITDTGEFTELLKREGSLSATEERARLLAIAVDLYRGELLPGCYDEWALNEQTRFAEEYSGACFRWAEALRDIDDLEGALSAIQRLIGTDPYREDAQRMQMRLLATLDRTPAALERYAAFERLLRNELDALPAPATRELAERLQREPRAFARERELHAGPAEGGRRGKSAAEETLPPALFSPEDVIPEDAVAPMPMTPFFGRKAEVGQVTALLAREGSDGAAFPTVGTVRRRLVTVTGPGGVGKTRLAMEVARRLSAAYRGRVWFARLDDLTDPSYLAPRLLRALQVQSQGSRPLFEQVCAEIGLEPGLLILDNFEHLLRNPGLEGREEDKARAETLVRMLLQRAPGLRCLVTSRRPLHLGGEQEFPLAALAVPRADHSPDSLARVESVALYLSRAQAAKPDFTLSATNAASVAALCRKLEGLPLAVEMAAAWVKVLPPAKMVDRLDCQLDLMAGQRSDGPTRHQSLRTTISWSYDLLGDRWKELFARLAVFRGGWTLEAAEAVGGADTLTGLMALYEHSMVVVEEREDRTRYRLLAPLREFALERLRERGDAEDARMAHARFFRGWAAEANANLWGEDQIFLLDSMEEEHENLLLAIERLKESEVDGDAWLRLTADLWYFWLTRGYGNEGVARLAEALRESEGRETQVRGRLLDGASVLAWQRGNPEAAGAYAQQALELFTAMKNQEGRAHALRQLADIAASRGDLTAALASAEESLDLANECGNQALAGWTLLHLGSIERWLGNFDRARKLYERSLEIGNELGNSQMIAYGLTDRALCLIQLGENDAARAGLQESLRRWREIEVREGHGTVRCLEALAQLAFAEGQYSRMAYLFGRVEQLREALHAPISTMDRRDYSGVPKARAAMGEDAFDRAWMTGRSMKAEQVLLYILSDESGSGTSPSTADRQEF
jgi:predicted ATPase/DNA-binding SARP family transcriptional activator